MSHRVGRSAWLHKRCKCVACVLTEFVIKGGLSSNSWGGCSNRCQTHKVCCSGLPVSLRCSVLQFVAAWKEDSFHTDLCCYTIQTKKSENVVSTHFGTSEVKLGSSMHVHECHIHTTHTHTLTIVYTFIVSRDVFVWQCVVVRCNIFQHVPVCCSALHTWVGHAAHIDDLSKIYEGCTKQIWMSFAAQISHVTWDNSGLKRRNETYCNTLQHTATCCNKPCNKMQEGKEKKECTQQKSRLISNTIIDKWCFNNNSKNLEPCCSQYDKSKLFVIQWQFITETK